MNKRISTMFASFLLMAGVAFAADGTTYSQKEAKPTEGLKVYLGNEEGTSFLKSAKVTELLISLRIPLQKAKLVSSRLQA